MSAAIRPGLAPFGWSVALHAALAGLLLVSLARTRVEPPPPVLPIDAVIVDRAILQAVARQRSEDDRLRERQEESVRLERAEAERLAAEQRQVAAEQAAKRKAQATAEAKRKAEQQAQAKVAAERKKKAEDARLKTEREAELRARLAEEEQRTSAAFQGLKARYIAAIQAHVERRWFKPPGTPAGASCTVQVTQIPGGEVVSLRFGACQGGEAIRRSIETAVRNASPLPPPPEPGLFEREVRLVFTPEE